MFSVRFSFMQPDLVGVSMIVASGLSFLGLGVNPPDPE
jgi:ABC-type dipeptide/oligopeptide/nickel transport system permease subunit